MSKILNTKTNREILIGSHSFKRALREGNIDLDELRDMGFDKRGKPIEDSDLPKKEKSITAEQFLRGIDIFPDADAKMLQKDVIKKMTIDELHKYLYNRNNSQ